MTWVWDRFKLHYRCVHFKFSVARLSTQSHQGEGELRVYLLSLCRVPAPIKTGVVTTQLTSMFLSWHVTCQCSQKNPLLCWLKPPCLLMKIDEVPSSDEIYHPSLGGIAPQGIQDPHVGSSPSLEIVQWPQRSSPAPGAALKRPSRNLNRFCTQQVFKAHLGAGKNMYRYTKISTYTYTYQYPYVICKYIYSIYVASCHFLSCSFGVLESTLHGLVAIVVCPKIGHIPNLW